MSPRTAEKVKEIRQESMQKIMDAAMRLIAKRGYEGTSISQIAQEAGVSKGLVYNYFESKEELLQRMVVGLVAKGEEVMAEIQADDPAKTLENLFVWFFKEMRERPEYYRMMTELTFRIDRFAFVHEIVEAKAQGYAIYFEELLRRSGIENPAGEAKILGALFDGIAIQYLVIRENYPLDELENYLIEKYCRKKS